MTAAATPRREGRDVTTRLNGDKMSPGGVERYVNPLIEQRLQILARDGWEADGATDVLTLWRQGSPACRERSSFWMGPSAYAVTSVTIRVRRGSPG
jgi:hypothetical protein